jgi:hypothetical protein
MKKQFQIAISGQESLTIDIVENEAIDIHICSHASTFIKAGMPPTVIKVSGMRWADNGFFNFDWGTHVLNVQDAVSVILVEDTKVATPAHHEEKYIEPEKDCSFCDRKASEVPRFFERGFITRICSDCVTKFYQIVEDESAT